MSENNVRFLPIVIFGDLLNLDDAQGFASLIIENKISANATEFNNKEIEKRNQIYLIHLIGKTRFLERAFATRVQKGDSYLFFES